LDQLDGRDAIHPIDRLLWVDKTPYRLEVFSALKVKGYVREMLQHFSNWLELTRICTGVATFLTAASVARCGWSSTPAEKISEMKGTIDKIVVFVPHTNQADQSGGNSAQPLSF